MRMSFSSAVVEDVKQSPFGHYWCFIDREVLCSYKMILRMKNEIVLYLIKHCAESYGIPAEQVSSRKLRDYCYAGFSKDEFLSVCFITSSLVALECVVSSGCDRSAGSSSARGNIPSVRAYAQGRADCGHPRGPHRTVVHAYGESRCMGVSLRVGGHSNTPSILLFGV